MGVTGSGTQTRPGSVGGGASWGASRGRSHESPCQKLHVVARHLKRPGTKSPQLSAVTKRTPTSPATPVGVAKGTLGTPTSRLCGTIPGSDVSGAGRRLYQVARGATNVIYHHCCHGGEVEAHLCCPWASPEDCHRQWSSIYQLRVCRVPGGERGGPCTGGALSPILQRAGGKGSADLQVWSSKDPHWNTRGKVMSFPVHIPNHPARHNWTVSSRTSLQSTSALTTGPGSPGYRPKSPFTTGQASSGPESRPSTTTGTRPEGLREEFLRGPHLAAGSGSRQDRSGVIPSADGGWTGFSQTCGPPTQPTGVGAT